MMIQQATWAQFYPECMELAAQQYEEIGEDGKRMPLDPDADAFENLEKAGMLQILTARDDAKKMIGYCLFIISHNLLSRKILCATQCFFFVTKSARQSKAGGGLYLEAIRLLKERGVKNIYPHYWTRGDGPMLKRFFEKLGAVELEHAFSLWVGE